MPDKKMVGTIPSQVLDTHTSEAAARDDFRPPAAGSGKKRPAAHLRDAFRLATLAAKAVRGALVEAPGALLREHDYFTGKRRSANLILTWGCTSKCKSCTAWRRRRDREQELTLEEWLGVAEQLAARGVRVVELFGGDIFLRKDVVIPLSRELKRLGCELHVPTNSNLVDKKTAEALVESLDFVYISMDGVAELHDSVRGVRGTFGRLSRCLECFLEARGARRSPTIVCNTTVSRHNAHALARIADFAAEAGYDEIHFEYVGEFNDGVVSRSRIGHYEPSPIYRQVGESCLLSPQEVSVLREQLTLAHAAARRNGNRRSPFRVSTVNTDVLRDDDLINGTVPCQRCFIERTEIVIDPYGNIVPCFFFDTFSVGNVRDGALGRNLETNERRRFRQFRDHGKLEMCKHCIHAVVRNRTGADVIRREFVERFRPASVGDNS